MEQNNSKINMRKGLEYLVGNAYRKVLPVVLAGSMLFTTMGCPWNKHKDRDDNTTSGSSVRVLSAAGVAALNKRFEYNQVNLNKGESQQLLRKIATNTEDVQDRYSAEVEKNYDILLGGTPMSYTHFADFNNFRSLIDSNDIISSCTRAYVASDPLNPLNGVEIEDQEIEQMLIDVSGERETTNKGVIDWPYLQAKMVEIKDRRKVQLREIYLKTEIENPGKVLYDDYGNQIITP